MGILAARAVAPDNSTLHSETWIVAADCEKLSDVNIWFGNRIALRTVCGVVLVDKYLANHLPTHIADRMWQIHVEVFLQIDVTYMNTGSAAYIGVYS